MNQNFWKDHPALQNSPKLLEAFEKTSNSMQDSTCAYSEIVGMWEKGGDVFSLSAASFWDEKPAGVLGLELYSEKSGLLLQTEYLDKKDFYTLEGISRFSAATNDGKRRAFRAEAHFMWLEPDGGIRTTDCTKRFEVQPQAIAEATNVTAPRARNQKITIVLYGREAAEGECEDYKYPENKMVNNRVKVMLPVRGEVIFNSEFTIKRVLLEEPFAPVMEVIPGLGAEPAFYKKEYAKAFSIAGNRLLFNFEEDWGTDIDVHLFNVSTILNFYLTFKVEVESEKFPYTLDIVVTSLKDLYDAGTPTTAIIEPISIRWGCLAKGTQITMEDGSLRRIEDIRSGDMVRTQRGTKRVVDILSGREDNICCLETESGKRLLATGEHPVLTTAGMKRIKQLRGDDLLVSEESDAEPLCGLYTMEYGDMVYNLMLEDSDSENILANGLWTGDFTSQNSLPQRKKTSLTPDVQVLQQEMENLALRLQTTHIMK